MDGRTSTWQKLSLAWWQWVPFKVAKRLMLTFRYLTEEGGTCPWTRWVAVEFINPPLKAEAYFKAHR